MYSRAIPLAVLLFSIATHSAAAATVSGKLTINGVKYEMKHAYAYKESAKPDAEIILVVTDAPVPPATLRDTFGFIHLVEEGKIHGLKLTLREKQCISGAILDKATINASGVWGNDMIEVDSVDATTLTAHAATPPQTMFGNKFEYTFGVVVPIETPKAEAPATAEQKKAAESSLQGKLYREFTKAVKASDVPTLRRLVNKEMASRMDDPEFPKALEFIKSMMATNVELQVLTLESDSAKITAKGKDPDGKNTFGVLTFVREGSEWKVAKESWNTPAQ